MGFGLDRLDADPHEFELDDVEDQHIAQFMYPACKTRPGWIAEPLQPPGKPDLDDWGDE